MVGVETGFKPVSTDGDRQCTGFDLRRVQVCNLNP